jgi:hypothetical protein
VGSAFDRVGRTVGGAMFMIILYFAIGSEPQKFKRSPRMKRCVGWLLGSGCYTIDQPYPLALTARVV